MRKVYNVGHSSLLETRMIMQTVMQTELEERGPEGNEN